MNFVLKEIAWNRNPNVGFNRTLRLLRLLLHALPPKDLLHFSLGSGSLLCLCDLTPSISTSSISSISRSYVCRSRPVFYHPDSPWDNEVRLGNADVEDESGLDGFDDGV